MAAADGFELQDEEAQAEHGSHLLQLTGTELQTLPSKRSSQLTLLSGDNCRMGRKIPGHTLITHTLRTGIIYRSLCGVFCKDYVQVLTILIDINSVSLSSFIVVYSDRIQCGPE